MEILYYQTASGRMPAREYITALPEADRAAIAGDLTLIEQHGIRNAPINTRHLGGKLWEIKTGTGNQQRLFYCLIEGGSLVILHACKKQRSGAQHGDVKTAEKRMREVLS